MIPSLLIANRGEIACRIIRTARRMGVRTVAVYSDADAHARHVRQADEAIHIGASPAGESYLQGHKIIAAAKATGAAAIHPGYGFLSENAEFAQSVIDAGLIWVGPAPASIRAMGRKDAAKKLMATAGVPVTPGYLGEDQTPATLAAEAAKIGYPVLIKAVAGGGGKGMRLVEQAADFADALASCQREAATSFASAEVLIEKYIASPRHIEVQVFGDSHGHIVHLFERDCSLQRRHQKVIEEAPAPGMDEATRAALCATAVRAARAVDYVGAGTVEFIADASQGLRADRIWFMEMNTRLQVEHPVTEAITGVDLVEWQLRVASGEALPLRQEELAITGYAIEARLYAEDPARGFLPSVGQLQWLMLPEGRARVETGVESLDGITPYYDPMIAKLVVHAADRKSAFAKLADALDGTGAHPVKTNASFLWRLSQHSDVVAGKLDTGLIARNQARLTAIDPPSAELLAGARHWLDRQPSVGRLAHGGFRLNAAPRSFMRIEADGVVYEVDNSAPSNRVMLTACGVLGWRNGATFPFRSYEPRGSALGYISSGTILAPMPGRVIAVEVSAGDAVSKGQKLLTLEAMKMEHTLVAPFNGTVAELSASPGAQVRVDAPLARIEPAKERD